METLQKIEDYYKEIEQINYDNREGGRYAYVKFLSLTRELLFLMEPVAELRRQVQAIEQINWVFNHYLPLTFTEQQRVIFNTKREELRNVLNSLTAALVLLDEGSGDPAPARSVA